MQKEERGRLQIRRMGKVKKAHKDEDDDVWPSDFNSLYPGVDDV